MEGIDAGEELRTKPSSRLVPPEPTEEQIPWPSSNPPAKSPLTAPRQRFGKLGKLPAKLSGKREINHLVARGWSLERIAWVNAGCNLMPVGRSPIATALIARAKTRPVQGGRTC